MKLLKPMRTIGAVAILSSLPLLAASAQTTPPSPAPSTPPSATEPAPMPPRPAPSTRPSDPAAKPIIKPGDRAANPEKANPLIGLAVFSSDGTKLGSVQGVSAEPDGKVKAIHVKTGGFLGFGGKLVAIQDGKFTRAGDNVQLGMTSEEVSKLPEVKEQS